MGNKFAIFIDSFDGNSDVWEVFFKVFDEYWPDCSFQRYLVNNHIDFDRNNLKVIHTGDDSNWFNMTIKGLEAVEESFILLVLEDQLISKKMNNNDWTYIVDKMNKDNIFFYRMTCPYRLPQGKSFVEVPKNTHYPISLQPAIWDKNVLLDFLKKLQQEGCKSPWDFERFFIDKYINLSENQMIPGIRYDSRDIMGYQNIIIQGKWDPRVVRFYKKQGIYIDTDTRKYMERKAVLLDSLKRMKIFEKMSYSYRSKIKLVLKKLGFKFMT